ncbi:MAG: ABC transporter ATP-binding protein [Bacillota bacterium]
MLKVERINVSYGTVKVLHEVSLEVNSGELVAIIGSNGAGKTTLLKAIQGTLAPATGSITFDGARVNGMPAHALTRKGLVMVPEGRQIFANLSVRDNLLMGAFPRLYGGGRAEAMEMADAMLDRFPALKIRHKVQAGVLSGGEQQMLAMARALMAKPKLLMLDEPTLGLAPAIVAKLFQTIAELKAEGTTILLVEQKAFRALQISDRAYVLETGHIALSGKSETLMKDDHVAQFYLGGSKAAKRAVEA